MARTPRKRKRKGRYHRGDHTSSKSGRTYKFRSEWEHRYMIYLDTSADVVEWTYEQTVIEYVSNIRTKKIRKYHPDFFVRYSDEHEEIIEVKPKHKLEQLTVRKKAAAATAWCEKRNMTYKILTEVDLKALGII